MKFICRCIVAIALLSAFSIPTFAAKPKKMPSLPSGELFFTMKGQPYAMERNFPGITAALMLSEDQKAALSEAQTETIASPELRQKRAATKEKNNGTDEQREAVRREIEEARAKLSERVAAILTPEQKALVEKIQAAAMQAQLEARTTFEAEFNGAKGDKARQEELREKMRVEAEDLLVQKLEKILTPEQMQAVQKAAMEQRANEEAARKKKLG
jgi:Spy/CpxP family protein refolding chaperone